MFTVATFIIVPRVGPQSSLWLAERPETVGLSAFIKDVTLLLGSGGLASPLWSLRFEILFSLALPLYIWAARKLPKLTYVKLAACLAIITVGGYLNNTTLLYVPMFLIGSVIAEQRPRFGLLAARVSKSRFGWPIAFTAAMLLLASHGMAGGISASSPWQGATAGPTAVGACILVLAAIHWPAARKLLEARPVQWLGTISFSLYLIHEPIVVAFGFMFGSDRAVLAVIVSILTSLVAAVLFYRFVEKPSHQISKKVRWPRAT